MKLYVCWGTFQIPGARSHPCRNALLALRAAGHEPTVVKVRGFGGLPDLTAGRREVKRLSGQSWVPLLVTDDDEVLQGSQEIIYWSGRAPSERTA